VGCIGLEIQRTSGMACVWMTEGRPRRRGGGGTAGTESGSPSGTASEPAPVRKVEVTIRVSSVVKESERVRKSQKENKREKRKERKADLWLMLASGGLVGLNSQGKRPVREWLVDRRHVVVK